MKEEVKMVFDRVKEIIVDELSVDEAAVSIESTLEDLGADSLDAVELIMALEEEYDLEIAEEDAKSMKSVKNIVEYIETKSLVLFFEGCYLVGLSSVNVCSITMHVLNITRAIISNHTLIHDSIAICCPWLKTVNYHLVNFSDRTHTVSSGIIVFVSFCIVEMCPIVRSDLNPCDSIHICCPDNGKTSLRNTLYIWSTKDFSFLGVLCRQDPASRKESNGKKKNLFHKLR